MRFDEVVRLLEVGERARRESWLPGDYIRFVKAVGIFRLGSSLGTERVWQGSREDIAAYDWLVL
jgi:hypothetical protein